MQLPPDLKAALETITAAADTDALREASAQVSNRYRDRGENLQIRGPDEAAAYLAARFPATYAAAARSFEILQSALPEFNPRSHFDAGAGPGTVMLAALSRWPLDHMTLLEPNLFLRQAGQGIFSHLGLSPHWQAETIGPDLPAHTYDLVTAGYMLNELPIARVPVTVSALWRATAGALVVIEPGTPQGSAVMQLARDTLIAEGATLAAPCPQSGRCPLRDDAMRWCHFSVRVERSRLHRQVKDAALGYEDEKFSFIAAIRQPCERPAFRILGHPAGKKLLQLQVCDAIGRAETLLIPKSNPRHKQARKLEWGDGFI